MKARTGEFSYSDLGSRRNWIVCCRWSLSVLAAEFILVAILVGFALASRPDPKASSATQAAQAQQFHSNASRKACPLAATRRMQDL